MSLLSQSDYPCVTEAVSANDDVLHSIYHHILERYNFRRDIDPKVVVIELAKKLEEGEESSAFEFKKHLSKQPIGYDELDAIHWTIDVYHVMMCEENKWSCNRHVFLFLI